MFCHIGQDFSSKIELDIFPHIHVPHGVYSINLTYITVHKDSSEIQTHNYVSYISNHKNMKLVVGKDVLHVDVSVSKDIANYQLYAAYAMRIDDLILLNLICKILNFQSDVP